MMMTEPTSSTAPRFATDSAISSSRKIIGRSLTLLCPAQAYPAPAFRYSTVCLFFPLFPLDVLSGARLTIE